MIAVVGGGAAGMMAAAAASEAGAQVVLFEKNEKLGKKLYITGKGRCNVTNACPREEFFENIPRNPKFFYSGFSAFDNAKLMEFLEASGCPVKVERGNRVFPVSDRASDVTRALVGRLSRVSVRLNAEVGGVEPDPSGGFRILTERGAETFKSVILATGGVSYPATGSTGDGYRFAKSLGHAVTDLRPALVGMKLAEDVKDLSGLTLKNVGVRIRLAGGRSLSRFGEMLFTHVGVSGPVILTLSSLVNRERLSGAKLVVDLKPALDFSETDGRLVREFRENANRQLRNILPSLMPRALIPVFLEQCGASGELPANAVTAAQRKGIAEALKGLTFSVRSLCEIESGVVTSGGVYVREIDPRTMESKLCPGLYFAGEVLDVDGFTGGFNLQIAMSTGRLAGLSAAARA